MNSPSTSPIDAQAAARFDFIMAGCNHYHLPMVENPQNHTAAGYAKHYHQMLEGAMDIGFVNAIAHPWTQSYVPYIPQSEMLAAYPRDELERLIALAGSRRIALELNPSLVVTAIPFFQNVIQIARKYGTQFIFGSDAHQLAKMDYAKLLASSEYTQASLLEVLGIEESDFWYRVDK